MRKYWLCGQLALEWLQQEPVLLQHIKNVDTGPYSYRLVENFGQGTVLKAYVSKISAISVSVACMSVSLDTGQCGKLVLVLQATCKGNPA